VKRSLLAIPVLVVAVVAAFLLGGHSPDRAVAASSGAEAGGVVVDGVGQVSGTPDVLTLSMGVVATGADVNGTLDRANAQIARIEASLRAHGAKKEDLQTSNVSIYPTEVKRVRRYQVSEQLTAKLRDLKGAGAAISAAVAAGGAGVTLDGVSFSLEDNVALLDAARDKAFADAKRKAEHFARLSGSGLGKVQLIAETVQSPEVYGDKRAFASGLAQAASPVPIYAGSSQLNVRVTVRWALS
jgi:uncharacterized protein YggE